MTRSRWRALARWCACATAFLALAGPARAQVSVAVSAPATVPAQTPVLVRVEVTTPVGATVRLAPPLFAPFTLTRTDRAPTDTGALGGRQRLEWRFVLLAGNEGTFAFAPFEADVQGPGLRPGTFRSRTWSVAVLPTAARAPVAAARPSELSVADPARLAFDARVVPERVYVGEQTTLELRVGVGARVRERLRRSPEFAFPPVGGVVTYDLPARHASTPTGDVHVYRRALFPLAAGTVNVPPAQLVYALTPEDDPFGAESRVTAQTPVRTLIAVAPPTQGRPTEWDGAVGRFRASARVDTAHARVGDAITYTLRVEGTGNVLLLPRPAVTVPWADVSTAAERVAVDSSGDAAGGSKEFDWLLTPRRPGVARVPAVRYAYFDPRTAGYAFADAPAVDVRIAPGVPNATPLAPVRAAPAERSPSATLGVARTWDGEREPALVERRGFWFALAAVPVPGVVVLFGTAWLARLRTRRVARGHKTDDTGPPTTRSRAAADRAEFAEGVSTLLGCPASAVLDAPTLVRVLRRSGVSGALAGECAAAVDRWTRGAYGTADAPSEGAPPLPRALLARIAEELGMAAARAHTRAHTRARTVVAAERVARRGLPHRAYPGLAVGLAVLGFAVAAPRFASRAAPVAPAGDGARATSAFAAGVAAYAQGDAGRARDLFAAAATAAPNAPAAWLNAGTAAWSAGDTAAAAFAWQRAARLAPDLPGLRARLEHLPVVAAAGHVGAPPPVDARPVSLAALVAAGCAALWMLGAAAAYARRASGYAGDRAPVLPWRGALATYVVSLALAGGAALAARATDPRGLAVVRAGTALRPEPAFGASTAGSVVTGEVARVVADEAGWLRVRLDGGRDGWVRAAQVAPLDAAP